ncbi:NAD(P)(+) transhydrogenase (Re/Si-specific) subunit beta [bacterium]|nr:NAD(P)(+) transhydrogenase (Re/Si-specific) subunit beta [bacterium]
MIDLVYLLGAVLFILGIKGMGHPRTAVRANLMGAAGMALAIAATLLDKGIVNFTWIILGLVLGSIIGTVMAWRVQMTGMPQMVALLNGLGGAASMIVGGTEQISRITAGQTIDIASMVAIAASAIIGGVTLTGSLIAWAKLEEVMSGRSVVFKGQQLVNLLVFMLCMALSAWIVITPSLLVPYWILAVVACVLGILLVLPIGGADMPVAIALLNSYSGLAAAATGFVLNNAMLIVAGSLVGASGIILTQIMCKAMNRSLFNVLFGLMQAAGKGPSADEVYAGKIKSVSADEVAMLFDSARRCVIVPGYGLAVSQAQHAVRDLTNLLESRGCTVDFALHPVAGRMPGHMNVLLAEANIPYEKMIEMDVINPQFDQVDVVIVIGANDVVNPEARNNPTSPIAGMPILDVDKAGTVVVVKRSLSPGFAGIPNPLFAADNTLMYFGDGQQAVMDIVKAIKESS